MQYISIYRLAELCDVNTDRLDVFSTRDIQSALKNLYSSDELELYHIGKEPVILSQAIDFLWKCNSSDSLTFCQWVHEIPSLEHYLETNEFRDDLSSEIPTKIAKSFNFSRFGNFLSDFIEPDITQDIKVALENRDFKKVKGLNNFAPLLSRGAQADLQALYKAALLDLTAIYSQAEHQQNSLGKASLQFLLEPEFLAFYEGLDKNYDQIKSDFKNALTAALNSTQAESNDLKNRIAENYNLNLPQSFKTPEIKIFHDKPVKKETTTTSSTINTARPKVQTQIKSVSPKTPKPQLYPKPKTGKKMSPWHFIGIAFAIFALIFRIALRNNESSYDYTNYSFPDYNDSDFGSSDYFSEYNWDNSLEIIREYVESNENLVNVKVRSMDDWYNSESEEAISEPFGEFFYPLYNKDGADGFNIINETDYAVIIMVQGDGDCYSYFAESHSTYQEYFNLDYDDQIMFYFGKEYEETEDLDESEIAGFHFVDRNSRVYLDSAYSVGYGINPDRDNENDSFDYEIRITQKDLVPIVSFDYYRTVETEVGDIF